MPVEYSGIAKEHTAVRTAAGLFDVSHMGEFRISGPQALDLIQFVTSNDASKLMDGQAQYSALPAEDGTVVDDLLVYREAADRYMLVVNAANIASDFGWIQLHNNFDARIEDISNETSLLAVQGPEALAILQPLAEVSLSQLRPKSVHPAPGSSHPANIVRHVFQVVGEAKLQNSCRGGYTR